MAAPVPTPPLVVSMLTEAPRVTGPVKSTCPSLVMTLAAFNTMPPEAVTFSAPKAVPAPTSPSKVTEPAPASRVRLSAPAVVPSTAKPKVTLAPLVPVRSMTKLLSSVTAPLKLAEAATASSSSSLTVPPAMMIVPAVILSPARARFVPEPPVPIAPLKRTVAVPAVTVRDRFAAAVLLSALRVPPKVRLLSNVPSVLIVTLLPNTTAPVRVEVVLAAPALTFTVLPARLIVDEVTLRFASAWLAPTSLLKVVVPEPAFTLSVRLSPAALALTVLLKVTLPPPVVMARLPVRVTGLLRLTVPPAPATPAAGTVPAPAPPVVVMSPPRSIRVEPVRATTPPAPPVRCAMSVLSAALPKALMAPVVRMPPEFSVTLPAAKPTLSVLAVPPLVVIVSTVMSPVVEMLTTPPSVFAAPVVVMLPVVMLPAPVTVRDRLAPDIAPCVSREFAPTLNDALPVNVVVPKVSPAVSLFTLEPAATVRVCAPMERVPKVCVTPDPAVSRSEMICKLPDTVVSRPKFSPVSLANSSMPPVSVSVPAPKASALVVARNVPVFRVVVPV